MGIIIAAKCQTTTKGGEGWEGDLPVVPFPPSAGCAATERLRVGVTEALRLGFLAHLALFRASLLAALGLTSNLCTFVLT